MSDDQDAYARAGVSYAAMDPGKVRAQRAAASTAELLAARGLGELGQSRGESAYVVDVGAFLLSQVSEALGTKNLVADAVRAHTGRTHYDAIAQDTVATILNDLATVGGHPLSITAYWGTGSSEWFNDGARMADLVDGWTAACRAARCAWGGGETQVLVGMIEPGVVVLGGAAVGRIAPRGRLLLGERVREGDRILIAPSTGIHANGLTLARSIAARLPAGYATPVPGDAGGRGLGEVLLDPSPLYGPLVEAVQEAELDLHYAVHVTGHGWRKLMRAERDAGYVIERLPEVPPVLTFLAEHARLSPLDAYGTFNMGAGYALLVAAEHAAATLAVAEQAGFSLLDAGYVAPGPRRVVIEPLGLEFAGDSLAIR